MKKFVTYYRVSTTKQGESGLGLEAQQIAVKKHLESVGGTEIATFTEVETGKNNKRPKLQEALTRCRLTHATLIVAKFDRLSRNAAFLLTLRDSGMKFVAADMPDANDLTVGMMAIIAQHEREMISRRTKEALAAAKARGAKLGNPRMRPGDGRTAAIARKEAAAQYVRRAEELRPVFEAAGTRNVKQLCFYFSLQSIPSPHARTEWNAPTMRRLLKYWTSTPAAKPPAQQRVDGYDVFLRSLTDEELVKVPGNS